MTQTKIKQILLFGATGMLGRYIYSYFDKKIRMIDISYRITNENLDELENVLIQNNINSETCVINAIGLIPQRNPFTPDFFLVNSIFPQLLWQICKKYSANMIHPTTDCVFSGKRGEYLEHDSHDETGAYGISKSLGEPSSCTVIRTSIIGKELYNKKSFLEWVLSNDGKTINGYENHIWNGITCLEYCKIIERIIQENLFWSGIKHIYSPSPKSKYELAVMISSIFQKKIEIIPTKSTETVNKTLLSNDKPIFEIPELYIQLQELENYSLF
jgi:dTDP-4-dehydrorhamnose reductase